jgi:8-oxo-dGTP pyrophosphatase MutT (NUDIX family)
MPYAISFEPPENFHPTVEVSGCFCECKKKILLVKRHPNKPQGGTWGLPAGKLERAESPHAAAAREVYEEVGIRINLKDLQEVGKFYIRLDGVDYIFYMFYQGFQKAPRVRLEEEAHLEARWVTVDEALKLPLIIGGKEAMQCFISFFS